MGENLRRGGHLTPISSTEIPPHGSFCCALTITFSLGADLKSALVTLHRVWLGLGGFSAPTIASICHLGGGFEFTEVLRAGLRFGARRQFELALSGQHFADAGLNVPNEGITDRSTAERRGTMVASAAGGAHCATMRQIATASKIALPVRRPRSAAHAPVAEELPPALSFACTYSQAFCNAPSRG